MFGSGDVSQQAEVHNCTVSCPRSQKCWKCDHPLLPWAILQRLSCYTLVCTFVHMCLFLHTVCACIGAGVQEHFSIYKVDVNVSIWLLLYICVNLPLGTSVSVCFCICPFCTSLHETLSGHQSKTHLQFKGLRLNKKNYARKFNS